MCREIRQQGGEDLARAARQHHPDCELLSIAAQEVIRRLQAGMDDGVSPQLQPGHSEVRQQCSYANCNASKQYM